MRSASSAGSRAAVTEPVSRFTRRSISVRNLVATPSRSVHARSRTKREIAYLASGREDRELDVLADVAAQRVLVDHLLEHTSGLVGGGRRLALVRQRQDDLVGLDAPRPFERRVVDAALAVGLHAQLERAIAERVE